MGLRLNKSPANRNVGLHIYMSNGACAEFLTTRSCSSVGRDALNLRRKFTANVVATYIQTKSELNNGKMLLINFLEF